MKRLYFLNKLIKKAEKNLNIMKLIHANFYDGGSVALLSAPKRLRFYFKHVRALVIVGKTLSLFLLRIFAEIILFYRYYCSYARHHNPQRHCCKQSEVNAVVVERVLTFITQVTLFTTILRLIIFNATSIS